MRLKIKETCCPTHACLLVADNGTLTCELDHEQNQVGWHPNMQAKIDAALKYSALDRRAK